MNKNLIKCVLLLCTLLICGYQCAMASDHLVLQKEQTRIEAWSATLVQAKHGPPESDAIVLDLTLEENSGGSRKIAENIVGPIVLLKEQQKIISCEANGPVKGGNGPLSIDLNGKKKEGPQHPGYLRDCKQIEDSGLVLLHYNLVKNGRPYNLVRVIDSEAKIIFEEKLSQSKDIDIPYEGRVYRVRIPEPDWPG